MRLRFLDRDESTFRTMFPGEIFSLRGKHRSFLRISCGAIWSPAIERAMGLLGKAVAETRTTLAPGRTNGVNS